MKHLIVLPLALLLCTSAFAERILEKESAERTEVRYSQIGPRNTLLFYTFAEQQAVLKILIDNKDDSFPVSGSIYLFDADTSAKSLAKWVNNQHSDGLFPEVPKPIESVQIPKERLKVIKKGIKPETTSGPMGDTFTDHTIKLVVRKHQVAGKFSLKAFEDQSGVFVKVAEK